MKKYRVYLLATLPFLAVFAYWIGNIIPARPEIADPLHGYVVALSGDGDGPPHYVSTFDCIVVFGSMAIAMLIAGVGLWRAGAFRTWK